MSRSFGLTISDRGCINLIVARGGPQGPQAGKVPAVTGSLVYMLGRRGRTSWSVDPVLLSYSSVGSVDLSVPS